MMLARKIEYIARKKMKNKKLVNLKILLFTLPATSKHLVNIFNEGELEYDLTVSKMEIVQNAKYSYLLGILLYIFLEPAIL